MYDEELFIYKKNNDYHFHLIKVEGKRCFEVASNISGLKSQEIFISFSLFRSSRDMNPFQVLQVVCVLDSCVYPSPSNLLKCLPIIFFHFLWTPFKKNNLTYGTRKRTKTSIPLLDLFSHFAKLHTSREGLITLI